MDTTPVSSEQRRQTMVVKQEQIYEKDEVYYWADNVTFLVERKLFRVSRHQFIVGSEYFAEKYRLGLPSRDDRGTDINTVVLQGVTAVQFRAFLRIVFPVHTTSTTTSFTKEEWLTILDLSVRWQFHDFRKLAIEHLNNDLTAIELIKIGRSAYVPRWVLSGYKSLVERDDIITEEEADDIGNRTVNILWIVRYFAERKALEGALESELAWRFSGEITALEAEEAQRRTSAELELEARRVEEKRSLEEERRVKAAAEQVARDRQDEETARREQELQAARLAEEERRWPRGVLIAQPDNGQGASTTSENPGATHDNGEQETTMGLSEEARQVKELEAESPSRKSKIGKDKNLKKAARRKALSDAMALAGKQKEGLELQADDLANVVPGVDKNQTPGDMRSTSLPQTSRLSLRLKPLLLRGDQVPSAVASPQPNPAN